MNIRSLTALGLLVLPGTVSAQRIPTRGGRSPLPTQPAPQVPAVARQQAIYRSRWSTEAYYLFNSQALPTVPGDATRYTTFGGGTRSDYRLGDHFSFTLDMTASMMGDPQTTQTLESGVRYRPITGYERTRFFMDARAGYTQSVNSFQTESGSPSVNGNSLFSTRGTQSSRGAGLLAGAGTEILIADSWSAVIEGAAMRSRMTIYRPASTTGLPDGSGFWTSSYRLQVGLRYNRVSYRSLKQDPIR